MPQVGRNASLAPARDEGIVVERSVVGAEAVHRTGQPEGNGRRIWKATIAARLCGVEIDVLVGDGVTLRDICFVAELALFSNERARRDALTRKGLSPVLDGVRNAPETKEAFTHFGRSRTHPAFAPDAEPYPEKIERAAS